MELLVIRIIKILNWFNKTYCEEREKIVKKSVKKNFIYQSAYQILMVISPLITSPYISRVLGAKNLGIYSYYYSIAYFFGIFAILGIGNYGNRSIAKISDDKQDERNKLFCEIAVMQFITSIMSLFFYFGYIIFFPGFYSINATIEVLYVLSVSLDIGWFFFGIEEFKTTTIRSIIIRLITILSIFIFVKESDDLNTYTFIMAGGNLLATLALWACLKSRVNIVKIKMTNVIKHFKPNLLLFVPVISLALYHYMDKIMLGVYSNMEELGYYTNVDKVINIPLGLIAGLGNVMLPRISSLSGNNNWKSINYYIETSIVLSIWMGSAMCFGIMGVAEDFVPIFFGSGFEKCVSLLGILSPVIMLKAWSNVFRMQYLIPLDRDREFNISVIVGAVINIIINRIFIPRIGSIGAVIGTLLAEFCVAVLYTWFARKQVQLKNGIILSIIFIISGVIMYIFLIFLDWIIVSDNHTIMLLFKIIFGCICYSTITFSFMIYIKFKPFMKIFFSIMSSIKR